MGSDCNYRHHYPRDGWIRGNLLPQCSPQNIPETGWKGIANACEEKADRVKKMSSG
jgi:hypothetical protein